MSICLLYPPMYKIFPQPKGLSQYCHIQLQFGFSAKLKIQQVAASKMEPQSGNIIVRNQQSGQPAGRPPDHLNV